MTGIQKTETVWIVVKNKSGETYYITSKEIDRNFYYLYKEENGVAKKIAKARTPTELEMNYIFLD